MTGETHYKALLQAARVRVRGFEKGRKVDLAEGAARLVWDQQEDAPGLHRFVDHVRQTGN